MKKAVIGFILCQFLTMGLFSEKDTRLLRVQKPSKGLKKRYHLFVNIQDLQLILKAHTLELKRGETQIRLYGPKGRKLVKLGIVKNGRIKWLFRRWKKTMLCVKMDPVAAKNILDEANSKDNQTKYQLGLTQIQKNSERLKVLKCYLLVFHAHIDLYGILVYPLQATPGEDIGKKVSLKVFNEGSTPAQNFFVELILSKNQEIPVKPGISSENFQEDMLFQNGRIKVDTLAPGESKILSFRGPLIIPRNTPPGKYNLAAILDPENKLEETQESNNCITRFIFITNIPQKILPKPTDKPIDLRTTKKKGKGNI